MDQWQCAFFAVAKPAGNHVELGVEELAAVAEALVAVELASLAEAMVEVEVPVG